MRYEFEKLATGIYLYRDTLPSSSNIPEMLEKAIDGRTPYREWQAARVGEHELNNDHRKCRDFKVGKVDVWPINSKNKDLAEIYNIVNTAIHECKEHYEPLHQLRCNWQQVINFVRYGEGEFFNTHPDHGPSFTCTLSSVMYLNDDYEGGELWFEEFDLMVKPKKGDHFLFPSNYIYRHKAMPVTSGIKYSAVTMFDYSDKYHQKQIRRKDY